MSTSLLPILFADDTNVFLTGKNIDQMIEIMNGELNNVFLWLNSNKLSLNVKNTAIHGIYTTIGGLSSKFDVFLAARSQFDMDHGVDFSAPTCCQSATFVRPLFALYCPFFYGKK